MGGRLRVHTHTPDDVEVPYTAWVHTHTPDDVEVPYTAWFSSEFQDVLPAGIMFYHDFVKGCGAPGVYAQTNDTTVIMPADASRGDMEAHAHVPLLVRDFERTPAPTIRFGYQVCRTMDSGGDKQLTYDLLPGLG
ncbi:hypothetical protein JKP88DRAFT_283042 [Tribonema minus]|uniref:Uncharacterized protein n=1 Tax=Tribonema minus TaxID=303371 RepID=A0A835YIP5_9STRA|nr:hypothetical protein JKP88DRAFT_283042 [Tribonema minus]